MREWQVRVRCVSGGEGAQGGGGKQQAGRQAGERSTIKHSTGKHTPQGSIHKNQAI